MKAESSTCTEALTHSHSSIQNGNHEKQLQSLELEFVTFTMKMNFNKTAKMAQLNKPLYETAVWLKGENLLMQNLQEV